MSDSSPRGRHVRGSPRGRASPRSRPTGSPRGRGRGVPASPAGQGPIEQAPRGLCRYYWSTGSCNRGFDCTFQHVAKERVDVPQQHQLDPSAEAGGVDFFSTEGLALHSGVQIDEQHRLKPAEAHNFLKPFLNDSFEFNNARRVEGFTRIFASVNDRNKAWDSGHAQTFLDFIVHSNGLMRIGDILRYKPVLVDVGTDPRNLSFQRGYLPLLEFMTSEIILKTTMHQNVNALYTAVEQSFAEITETVRAAMSALISRKAWNDKSRSQNTLAGVIVFRTLTVLFSQLLSRFKQFIRNHPELQELVANLVVWFNDWSTGVITECGGAMEVSTCPECRVPIGGSHHALLNSNTRAAEFEDIARSTGARDYTWQNPWRGF